MHLALTSPEGDPVGRRVLQALKARGPRAEGLRQALEIGIVRDRKGRWLVDLLALAEAARFPRKEMLSAQVRHPN